MTENSEQAVIEEEVSEETSAENENSEEAESQELVMAPDFTVYDENGNEVVYDVLFTFESDETGKNYIVYTDNSKDEAGNISIILK